MFTGLAQLVEHWSPKPGVGSSSLSTRAKKCNMTGIIKYVKDSLEELRNHVTWPGYNEGLKLTVLVAIFSVIFALIIWALDQVFETLVMTIINLIG
tara:strand:- start:1637 stop:1924 length:288 start_codon:yes stop_codon:yes gene_type:complete